MNKNNFENIFFVGIGGIGMSALALYFKKFGKNVAGYDAVKSQITEKLTKNDIFVFFEQDINLIPKQFSDNKKTLVVFTPAIKEDNRILSFFLKNNFQVLKRAQVLGLISQEAKTIAIAGTHGKTSISAIVSHILNKANLLKFAFVGGIMKNYNSNFIDGKNENGFVVCEADEYDKSFLHLSPYLALVSAVEPDHLDIYQNFENLIETFNQFVNKVNNEGIKIINANVKLKTDRYFSYSTKINTDFTTVNHQIFNRKQYFDVQSFKGLFKDFELSLIGNANLENALAAISIAILLGIDYQTIKDALATFEGVERRFDKLFENEKITVFNDYAHHPTEIEALKEAIDITYPDKEKLIIFQPHLYSRTRDLAEGFAKILDTFDYPIVTDIYPAREKPIKNISAFTILDKMQNKNKKYVPYNQIINFLEAKEFPLILFTGAGDIDLIAHKFVKKLKNENI